MDEASGYNLWPLVIINSLVFIIFAFSFTKPKTKTDWRALGGFSAFIVALFTEMYGFPLTVYLLSGWLSSKYPGMSLQTHNMGHLWESIFGWKGDPHLNPLHLLSNVLIFVGFVLLFKAWQQLFQAQKKHRLATTGIYAYLRHPQYLGFITIMFAFLLQWPTIPTLVMFPILLVVYRRLARYEEKTMIAEFGKKYTNYATRVPAFIPHLTRGVPHEQR